jgi:DNA (cytosine-5)-methyltransferase 1
MGTGGGNVSMVMEPYTSSKASYHQRFTNDGKAETLVASDYKDSPTITYGLDRASFNQGENAKFDFSIDEEKTGPQVAREPGAVFNSIVRRLTPLECERLQGFPDYWTDIGDWVDSKGKKHKGESDSPRYKALGNSIALPFWQWMAEKMVKYVDEQTMASLFDGIGGFPLVFSRCGCKPIWASEIEEFPIAVTKIRFPEGSECE